jgi:hypothetical protein
LVKFNSTNDPTQIIDLENIKEFFGDNLACPITSAALYQDEQDTSLTRNLVSMNSKSYLVSILNNVQKSQTINFVIKAKTTANAFGYKKV